MKASLRLACAVLAFICAAVPAWAQQYPAKAVRVIVSSARGSIEVYALVTERFQPFFIEGRMIDEVGIPWHWGYAGIAPGDICNDLTASVGDANSHIPETKVFLCNIKKKESA